MLSKSLANQKLGLIYITLFWLTAIAVQNAQADVEPVKAFANISGCTDPAISGTAELTEELTSEGIKQVTIKISVDGMSDGKHAVHIHENGECTPCSAAGGHHDPGPYGVSRPDANSENHNINHPFHMGDLVNIEVDDGEGKLETTTNRITLSPGRLSIIDDNGSAFIIHTFEDTFCDDEHELVSGCAGGPREACGVISLGSFDDGD